VITISVVIATFNRAPLLAEALAQLRHQQFEHGDEVVVVDNASTDNTGDVIARMAVGFPVPIRHLLETSPGKTPALTAGIAASRGDILALTDDDVLVADDWVTTIRRLFSEPSADLIGGRVDPRWEVSPPTWLCVEQGKRYNDMASPLALLHYGAAQDLGARTAVGANLCVRRTVHDALGGFAHHLGRHRGTLLCGEDRDFCERAAAAGFHCEYRPELHVRHWVPAARTTLPYYLRWFYWSGVTEAVLDNGSSPSARAMDRSLRAGGGSGKPITTRCLIRRMTTSAVSAAWHALRGRWTESAASLMDAAAALGYLRTQVGFQWRTRGTAFAGNEA
jgi:glycosyltransferase involved in cell wall biosynthesis